MADQIIPQILNALPAAPYTPSGLYFIKDAANAQHLIAYVAANDGTSVRRVPSMGDIANEIGSSLAASNAAEFAADITARDAIGTAATANTIIFVDDASADATVVAGAAMFFYNKAADTYHKVFEFEGMDVQLTWAALADKPASAVAAIDQAVTDSHTHTTVQNTVLAGVSTDANGNLVFNGQTLTNGLVLAAPAEW